MIAHSSLFSGESFHRAKLHFASCVSRAIQTPPWQSDTLVLSNAARLGRVILPLNLSARCTAEALLFVEVTRQVVPPFRDQASSEESGPYFALAYMRLRQRVEMIGPWDDHCPQATRPWPGPADQFLDQSRRACLRLKPQRKSAHRKLGRSEVSSETGEGLVPVIPLQRDRN